MLSSSRFLWMGVSSWVLFAFLSALTKLFRAELDPLALVIPWIGLNALVVGIYIVLQNGLKGFQTTILHVHIFRGVLVFFPFLIGVYAIRHLPLGQFMTIVNLSPVILTLFAATWLKEKVGRREWISLLIGFVGMLICIRPQFDFIFLLSLAPLLDAVSIAFGNALIRRYPEEPTLNWVFYQEALGFLTGVSVWMFLDLTLPDLNQLQFIPLFVVVDLIAMSMNYHAFRKVRAAKLSPWFYVQIPAATLFGFILFEEIPQWTVVIGGMLIISGGLLNSFRLNPKK